MKSYLFLFILLVGLKVHAEDLDIKRWRVGLSGGLLLNTYDSEAGASWKHQVFDSPVYTLEANHSFFFHNDTFQLQYGIEIESLKSVGVLGGSKMITEGFLYMLRGGMLFRPFKNKKIAIGHSTSFVVADDLKTRVDTGTINITVSQDKGNWVFGGSDVSWDLVSRFWLLYSFNSHWEVFARFESRGIFFNYSHSLGVNYVF